MMSSTMAPMKLRDLEEDVVLVFWRMPYMFLEGLEWKQRDQEQEKR